MDLKDRGQAISLSRGKKGLRTLKIKQKNREEGWGQHPNKKREPLGGGDRSRKQQDGRDSG